MFRIPEELFTSSGTFIAVLLTPLHHAGLLWISAYLIIRCSVLYFGSFFLHHIEASGIFTGVCVCVNVRALALRGCSASG